MKQRPVIPVEISGIDEITDRGIKVVLRESGETCWLPKDDVDYLPGCVVIPEWLARRMNRWKSQSRQARA